MQAKVANAIIAALFGVSLGLVCGQVASACMFMPASSGTYTLIGVHHTGVGQDDPAEVARWTETAVWDEETATLTLADGRTLVTQ